MIRCVSIATAANFERNHLAEQHALRHRELIEREQWRDIYAVDGMEFDNYDNLAAEYFVACNDNNETVGVTRTYPTTIPFMLSDIFRDLVRVKLPQDGRLMEASRLVLDRTRLTHEQRKPVINELMVAFVERGLQRGIEGYVAFTWPKLWKSAFLDNGFDIRWLGPETALPHTGEIVRAGIIPVDKATDRAVRAATGLPNPVLDFGKAARPVVPGMARFSHHLELPRYNP